MDLLIQGFLREELLAMPKRGSLLFRVLLVHERVLKLGSRISPCGPQEEMLAGFEGAWLNYQVEGLS